MLHLVRFLVISLVSKFNVAQKHKNNVSGCESNFSKKRKNFFVPCISKFLIIASPREQVLGDIFSAQVVEYTLCLVVSNSQEHMTQSKQPLCLLRTDNKKEFWRKVDQKLLIPINLRQAFWYCKIDNHFWKLRLLSCIVLSLKRKMDCTS